VLPTSSLGLKSPCPLVPFLREEKKCGNGSFGRNKYIFENQNWKIYEIKLKKWKINKLNLKNWNLKYLKSPLIKLDTIPKNNPNQPFLAVT
jgi:hypothetical protein